MGFFERCGKLCGFLNEHLEAYRGTCTISIKKGKCMLALTFVDSKMNIRSVGPILIKKKCIMKDDMKVMARQIFEKAIYG